MSQLGRKRRNSNGRGDNGHFAAYQIGHHSCRAIVATVKPMILNHYVLAFRIAGFIEALAERSGEGSIG